MKDANVKKLHPLTKLLTFAPSVSDRAAEAAHVTPFQIGLCAFFGCTSPYMVHAIMIYCPRTRSSAGNTSCDTCPHSFAVRACISLYCPLTRSYSGSISYLTAFLLHFVRLSRISYPHTRCGAGRRLKAIPPVSYCMVGPEPRDYRVMYGSFSATTGWWLWAAIPPLYGAHAVHVLIRKRVCHL